MSWRTDLLEYAGTWRERRFVSAQTWRALELLDGPILLAAFHGSSQMQTWADIAESLAYDGTNGP